MIGFIGENVMNGLARITPWEQTKQELETGATAGKYYLDVRAKKIFDVLKILCFDSCLGQPT